MVRIEILDDVLILNVGEHPEILRGRFSLTFTEMGFQKDLAKSCYYLDDIIKIRSSVKDIVAHLKRKGYEVNTNAELLELEQSLNIEASRFSRSKELGQYIKDGGEVEELYIPGFCRTLKDYQKGAVKHLLGVENGANFSVPGSGKTTMIYAAFAVWKAINEIEKLLVIGPSSSFMAWEEEFFGCFGFEPTSFRLVGPDRYFKYQLSDRADIFLTTFQTASIDIERLANLVKQHKFMVVIDEAHYIKRFDNGIWANAILQISPYAKKRAICTGTPMPNGLLDLYSQLTFLWPTKQLLGEKQWYKAEVKRNDNPEWVQKKIYPFFYRIKKADLSLPEPIVHNVRIPMSKHQRTIYMALAARTLGEMELLTSREISELRHWRKAKIIRLLQTSSNPALLCKYSDEFQIPPFQADGADIISLIENYPLYEIPNKVIETIKLVKKLTDTGNKVLLWSTFVNNIILLKSEFEKLGIPVYTIFGGVPKDDSENEDFNREQQIKLFKKSEDPAVLIANPSACAESISLHRECHHAVYFDRSFNCGHFLQSKDRIHRIGLDAGQETHYYFIMSEESVDEVVNNRLEEKAGTMYRIIEDDLPIGEMSPSSDGWTTDEELLRDFEAVLAQLRGMIS